MEKRARSKHFGLPLATMLTEYAKQNPGEGSLEQAYRNSIYCAGVQIQEKGLIRSRYCGNRWCPVCGRIRMGKTINTYLPEVESWSDPHFVTLTVQNCGAEDLKRLISQMTETFTAVARKVKREQGRFVAIRKLECTFGRGYHPHFHVVVDGSETASKLLLYWIEFSSRRMRRRVESSGQDVQRVDTSSLVELFKYATKLVTKGPDGVCFVAPDKLDVIFRSLRNRRTYQTYGFNVDRDIESVTDVEAVVPAFTRISDRIIWLWEQDVADWVDSQTGECLVGPA